MTIPVPTTNPVQVLRNAADYLETHGWSQGGFFASDSPTPAACALGGIEIAVIGEPVDVFADGFRIDLATDEQFMAVLEAANLVVSHLRREHNTAQLRSLSKVGALARWNDRPGRTVTEVVTAMREAADWHDNSGGGA